MRRANSSRLAGSPTAYLLRGGAREIARATGYAPATAHMVLARLSQGRFLLGSGRRGYALDRERWRVFLGEATAESLPVWVDWLRVLPALGGAIGALVAAVKPWEGEPPRSPYLYASLLLRLDGALRDTLIGSGLPNPFAMACRLEEAATQFPERLKRFASLLAQGVTETQAG